MCGIAGFWNHRSGRPADAGLLHAMVESLRHRGPDQQGTWVDGELGIGTARLCVLDAKLGHQPMSNEDGSVRVVFNGEIYNHAELRRQLEARGHRFRSRSDTEVLVHAFEEWGAECVARLDGMFAFAGFDGNRSELVLVRDRLGIKPLYFVEGADGIAFASELKGLIPVLGELAPDVEAIDEFLTWEYVPAPRTILQGVSKLRPATLLRVRPGRPAEPRVYWQLRAGQPPAAYDTAVRELRDRLAESVAQRMIADVPLGAFLSGGIDSSIVLALMAGQGAAPLAFSLGFQDRSYDERTYARAAAARHGAQQREAILEGVDEAFIGRVADAFDEPFADVSALAMLRLSELARQDVTVVLSGDGGDELFAGYEIYRAQRWAHRLRRVIASRPWGGFERLLSRLPPQSAKKGPINLAKRFAEGVRHPTDLEQARWWVFAGVADRRALYTAEQHERLDARDPFEHYRQRLSEGTERGFTGLQRQLYADLTGYLPDDILTKVDRTSMAVSLEARVPFLDHALVEYAFTLPAEWKLRGGRSKVVLREAFGPELPTAVKRRGKQGFSVPLKQWLCGSLRPLMHELLDERRVRGRGWFRPDAIARLMAEHETGRANHAHRLWCLMSLELSLERLARRAEERGEPAPAAAT